MCEIDEDTTVRIIDEKQNILHSLSHSIFHRAKSDRNKVIMTK